MARKFGKKNIIKLDPLAYNVGLFGESGIGKTTLAVKYCQKLAGDEYIVLNVGREDGIDAIPDAIYENVEDFDKFDEIINDIINNRTTDYKDLKIVVIDTIDELFRITEPEVIRLHNLANPDKKVNSIKAAFGGFLGGENKAIELIIDRLWSLKDVGISFMILGHTKRRTVTDIATGEEYDTLSAKLTSTYFDAIKTKLHILGMASIDRSIEKHKVDQKIGKDKFVGKVTGGNRIITFRDNNFNIDSKSRFEEIVPQINFDVDEFIDAINDAIEKAHNKQPSKKSLEEAKLEQERIKEERLEEMVTNKKKKMINAEKNDKLVAIIKYKYPNAKKEQKEKIAQIMEEYNISNFKNPELIPTEGLEKIANILASEE